MKVTLLIPESYADITVRQYKQMMSKWKGKESNREAIKKVLEIFCGTEADLIDRMMMDDLNKVVRELTWLFQEPDISKFSLQRNFTMEHVEYGFIPNMQELTVGEFADLESYLEGGMYENLQEVLAVLYRPITKKKSELYEIEDYAPSQIKIDAMGECPMDVAIGAVVFFYRIEIQLAKNLQRYSHLLESQIR
jgi:hypothetical protein